MIKTIVVMIVLLNVQVVQYNTVVVQAVDEKPNLVLLGDSITSENKDWANFPANYCYANLLKNWWNNAIEVINEGVAGSVLRDVNIYERITIHHPKYLIILYGLNDLSTFCNSNSKQFYNYYNQKLDEIREQNPNITIFLSTITWVNSNAYPQEKQVGFKNITLQIANERNLRIANLWDSFYQNNSLLCDNLHTNAKGARVIANIFNETFYNLINNASFRYLDTIQIQKKYNINLNLNLLLSLNILEESITTESKESIHVYMSYIFLFLLFFAVSIVLFKERKDILRGYQTNAI